MARRTISAEQALERIAALLAECYPIKSNEEIHAAIARALTHSHVSIAIRVDVYRQFEEQE